MTMQTLSVGANPTIEIERVAGNLVVEGWNRTDLEAKGESLQIGQDANLITVSGGGDLHLSVPSAATLKVRLVGGDFRLENLDGNLELANAGGDAILRNLSGEVAMKGMIGGHTRMENVSKASIDTHKNGVGSDTPDRTQRKIDQAIRHAENKLRHADVKIQNAVRRVDGHSQARVIAKVGRWKWNNPIGPSKSTEALQPISDEERITILKMLQERKITAEQAEKLLAALEEHA